MAFVYERVHPEDEELWNSIGWRDWKNDPLSYANYRKWYIDRERKAYLKEIGGFIDMPDYYDFCYKGVIVRMEVSDRSDVVSKSDKNRQENVTWIISNMRIPESLWTEREEIIGLIKEAFMSYECNVSWIQIKNIKVEIKNNPVCVEADYNGR